MSAEKVAKSIKLLDDNVGKFDWLPANWRELIELDWLDMDSIKKCVLGQLYRKVDPDGGYDDAYCAMFAKGIAVDSYAFAAHTYEWVKQIKEGLKMGKDFDPGTIWYAIQNNGTRTILSVHTVDGRDWVTYSWSNDSLRDQGGVKAIKKSDFLTDGFSTEKPMRFKKGDRLVSTDGSHFYYFSDDKLIKLSATGLSWSSLEWFEENHGKMVKGTSYSDAGHYFSGEFFWDK